jgi:hypothetical protein
MQKVYNVKSNAVRAAKKFGLARKDVFCVPGGWTFETAADKAEIEAERAASLPQPVPAEPASQPGSVTASMNPAGRAQRPKPARTAKPATSGRKRGKSTGIGAQVIAAIKARWTSIDDLIALSGWQRHTVRGYLSTTAGKQGITIERRKVDGMSQYRVQPEKGKAA